MVIVLQTNKIRDQNYAYCLENAGVDYGDWKCDCKQALYDNSENDSTSHAQRYNYITTKIGKYDEQTCLSKIGSPTKSILFRITDINVTCSVSDTKSYIRLVAKTSDRGEIDEKVTINFLEY